MSMSFEESLQKVCKNLLLSPEDRQSFTKDAEYIRNELMSRMKECDTAFKDAYDGLSLTGSYLDRLKINLPDEFDLHIKLKMPFPIKPCRDVQRPGFVILTTPKGISHDIVKKDRIVRWRLQRWIRIVFNRVLRKSIILDVNGRNYLVEYPTCGRGVGVAHTIVARDMCDSYREIWFDFVPVFEFKPSQWPLKTKLNSENLSWFAVPFGKRLRSNKERSNKYAFMMCAPHWERIALHDKHNLKNSLRLMKALRNKNSLGRLSSYMLKSIYLQQIDIRSNKFWEQPMGVILIAMLNELSVMLSNDSLPFFLHKGFNHLDLLPKDLIEFYQRKVDQILQSLSYLQLQSTVDYNQVASLFIR